MSRYVSVSFFTHILFLPFSFIAFVFKDSNLNEEQDFPNEIKSTYYISKKLGYGACGMVRLVYDRRTCINYAMKHVMKNILAESVKVNNINDPVRVMNEAKIMKALEHVS